LPAAAISRIGLAISTGAVSDKCNEKSKLIGVGVGDTLLLSLPKGDGGSKAPGDDVNAWILKTLGVNVHPFKVN
jgi:hypothetical protein